MTYTIKAIPTTYAGVNFRSRLEARWAAFFDLCGWKWDYEPFDLDGWAPDFLIKTLIATTLVEVKPTEIERIVVGKETASDYEKAIKHSSRYQVMLLGVRPVEMSIAPGSVLEPPDRAGYDHEDIIVHMGVGGLNWATGEFVTPEERWREAGNIVQWKPDNNNRRRRRRAA